MCVYMGIYMCIYYTYTHAHIQATQQKTFKRHNTETKLFSYSSEIRFI